MIGVYSYSCGNLLLFWDITLRTILRRTDESGQQSGVGDYPQEQTTISLDKDINGWAPFPFLPLYSDNAH